MAKDSTFQDVMGKQDGFSYRDIELANKLYKCGESKYYVLF